MQARLRSGEGRHAQAAARPSPQCRSPPRAVGISRKLAKRRIGHTTDSMCSQYNIVTDDALRAGVAKPAAG